MRLTIEILAARERDLEAQIKLLRAELARAQVEILAAHDLEIVRERDVLTDMGVTEPPATARPALLSDAEIDAEIVEAARVRAAARRLRRYG